MKIKGQIGHDPNKESQKNEHDQRKLHRQFDH